MTKYKLFILVFTVFLLTRLVGLGYDMSNSDAARWHRRSENFLTALKHQNFAKTYQHYQPGVTLMWLNAITKQSVALVQTDPQKTLENADWFPIIDGISKAVIIFVLAGLLAVQVYVIAKIYTVKVALLYGFFLAVEPYMIGIDRWFHLTALETYTAFCAFLLLLYWSEKRTKKLLVLSAVFLALSILSKLTSFILLPLFLVIIFDLEKKFKPAALYIGVILLTLFLVFPAFWADGLQVLQKFFLAVTNAVGNDIRAQELSGPLRILFYPVLLAFKLSPLTLVAGFLAFTKYKELFASSKTKLLLIYLVFYFIVMSIPDKKIDRYALVFISPLLLLISVYLATLQQKVVTVIAALSLLFLVYVIYVFHPIYSAYYSPIFGGTREAINLGVYDNSGEYFAQAAFYLNSKGRNNYTFIPDNIESFSYYYKGFLQREFDSKTTYIVRSHDIDRKEVIEPNCPTLDKTFGTKEAAVIYVFTCQK